MPERIFVLDAVNLSPQQLTQTESEMVHFLRRSNGQLDSACFLYRLTRDGFFSSSKLTQDGNLLAEEVEQHKSPRTMWRSGRNSQFHPLGSWDVKSQPNSLSLRALGSIAVDQREIRRRKVVVWIGPGWPVNGCDTDFDQATELSTRLREARIRLDNVNVWPSPNRPSAMTCPADTPTGRLWPFNVGQWIHASPLSYAINGKEYFSFAAGGDVFSFSLP